jgi:hypothetical protein
LYMLLALASVVSLGSESLGTRDCIELAQVKVKIMLRPTVSRPDFHCCQTVAGLFMWGALSDERTGLPFTIAAGPRQCSHSWVRFPLDSSTYFTVSDSRLPQPGGPGPRIYIPQEQGGPVILPGTEFPFHRLLRLSRFSRPEPLLFLSSSSSTVVTRLSGPHPRPITSQKIW